ncbi:MAG: TolC family protein [Peptococcaceae bacterium]|nr:TolC family protein [Peptococcaceae bacterium]
MAQAWRASDVIRAAQATVDKSYEQRKDAAQVVEATSFIPAPGPEQSPYADVAWTGLLKADAAWQMAEKDLASKKESVALEVYQKYFTVLSAQAAVYRAEAVLARDRWALQVARAVYWSGSGTKTQLAGAEAKAEGAEKGLAAAREALDKAWVAFNRLIGLQPQERPVLTEEPVTVLLTVYSLDAEVERAVESSTDVFKLQMLRSMAQWDLDYPWTLDTYGRAVYRTYNVQKYEVDIADLNLTSARDALRERVRTTYHDIRALEEQEAALEAAVKTAQDALKVVQAQLRQSIELQVRQGILNLGAAAEEVATAGAAIEQAREALRIAQVRFREGVGTNLEVISAQAALAQAEGARVQALFSYNTARAQLERAVGGPVQ